jgi:CRISPR-associated protein Cas8b/Csh1 subtype I-B
MELVIFDDFQDPYLQTEQGRGAFLAGVLLGYMARCQAGKDDDIKKAPLFKQIDFGRMDLMRLKRLLARAPQLISAYEGMQRYSYLINQLAAEVGRLLLSSKGELGVDGNFAFTVGFGNATSYFWKLFGKKAKDETASEEAENEEGGTDNGVQE